MRAKTEQPIKVKRMDAKGEEIPTPAKDMTLIEKAQHDGIYTAEEYTIWLKGYNACINEVIKDME